MDIINQTQSYTDGNVTRKGRVTGLRARMTRRQTQMPNETFLGIS